MNILSAVKQALNALESVEQVHPADDMIQEAIDNLRAAIEQVEKAEPDYELLIDYSGLVLLRGELKHSHGTKLYAFPPDAQAEIERLTYKLESIEHAYQVIETDNHNLTEKVIPNLRAQLAERKEEIERLKKSRDHWKANHDNRVEAARVLIERTDLPLERVTAYKNILEMQEELFYLRARLSAALKPGEK